MRGGAAQPLPAPRPVPGTLAIRVLFGGFLSQFGWLFVAFGMVFVWVFDAGGGLAERVAFARGFETTRGMTTGFAATSLSINEVRVYETSYTYDHPGVGPVSGASFATGSWEEEGRPVTIEYVPSDPTLSRIAGMRSSQGGLTLLLVLVFPAVGLILAGAGLSRGMRTLRLLKVGHVTRGTLLTTEATSTRINEQPVMKLTFEFDAQGGGTYRAVAKTHLPHGLEDEERELLVYDPRDPSRAAMLDELPCQPRFDEQGNLDASRGAMPSAAYLLLPGFSVLTTLRYLASLLAVLAVLLLAAPGRILAQAGAPDGEWPVWGGDAGATRYSALDLIDASNVDRLQVAWRWRMDNFGPRPEGRSQTVPLVVDGRMYATAGMNRDVVAIDPATGQTLWMYRNDEGERSERAPRRNSGRGVAWWPDPAGGGRVLTITPGFHLVALDGETGRPVAGFGDEGVVDLMEGLRIPEGVDPVGMIGNSSPPVVAGDVVIVGPAFLTGFRPPSMANVKGDIRAFDARTGRPLWTFRTIPEPGEPGSETWTREALAYSGNAGVWPPFTADPELGLVYLPVEASTNDIYGGHRPGDNLYTSSLVAVDLRTGERVWHYQLIHHDIWDYDMPAAPILADADVEGRGPTKMVVALTKMGWAFVFDRETGEPIWPIEERTVPPSDVPGEVASPTQPFPTRPAPFDVQGVTVDDLIDFTPELRAEALETLERYRFGPLYTPPSVLSEDGSNLGTLMVPGALGAAAWEGGAVDVETGVLYVGSSTVVTGIALAPDPDASDMRYIQSSEARTPTVRGLPILKPPYGRITAIDLKTGDHLWAIPNGDTPESVAGHPALEGLDIPPTGKSTRAGTLVTRTLLFAGEGWGGDPWLRAIDKRTGEVLHRVALPGTQNGHPITYEVGGRQFIVMSVGAPGQPPELVALALGDGAPRP